MKIKKSLMSFLLVLCLILPCMFLFSACNKNVTEVGFVVLYDDVAILDTGKTVYFDYNETDLVESHIVVKAVFSDGSTAVLNKKTEEAEGYEIVSTVPTDRVPEVEYSYTISYKEWTAVVIKVKFNKQNLATPVLTQNETGFSWTAIQNATGYEYQVSTDGQAWPTDWQTTTNLNVQLNWGEYVRVRAITTSNLFNRESAIATSQAWEPTRTTLAVPTIHSASQNLTFTVNMSGETRTPVVNQLQLSGFDSNLMEYSDAGQNLMTDGKQGGSWNFSISLKDTNKYTWADGTTTPKVITWTIKNQVLPVITFGSLTYSGSEQTVTINGLNETYLKLNETAEGYADKATNAGTYYVVVEKLYDYVVWADGVGDETATRKFYWTIDALSLGNVSLSQNNDGISWTSVANATGYTYQIKPNQGAWGEEQTTTSNSLTGLNYGDTVRVKATKTGDTNYQDGTYAEITWTPTRTVLTSPAINSSSLNLKFVADMYSETKQKLVLDNFDDETMTISKPELVSTGIICGTETFTISVKNSNTTCFKVDGNETTSLEFTWTIAKKDIKNPSFPITTFEYDGNPKFPGLLNGSTEYVEIASGEGLEAKTNAGTYTYQYRLTYPDYTYWETPVEGNVVTISFTITKKNIEKPTRAFESVNYTGSAQTLVTVPEGVSSFVTITPEISQTNAGTYNYTIVLKDKANLQWADGTTDDITFTATINAVKLMMPSITEGSNSFTWNAIANATGYEYQISTDGQTWPETWTSTTETQVAVSVGQYIRVRAISTNTNYLTSNIATSSVYNPLKTQLTIPTISDASANAVFEVNESGIVKPILTLNYYDSSIMEISVPELLTTGHRFIDNTRTESFTISIKAEKQAEYYFLVNGAEATTTNVIVWTIKTKTITAPTLSSSSFVFNGSAQEPAVQNFDSLYMEYDTSSTKSATNVGSYSIKVKRKYPNLTTWDSSVTTSAVTLNWSISKISLAKPTAIEGLETTWTGEAQTLITIPEATASYVTVNPSSLTQTDVGTYNYTISIADKINCQWADETNDDVTFTVKINAIQVAKPTVNQTGIEYDGTSHVLISASSETINACNTLAYNVSQKNAGTYSYTFTLKAGYEWDDSTTENVTLTAKINKKLVAEPSNISIATSDTSLTETQLMALVSSDIRNYVKLVHEEDVTDPTWGIGEATEYYLTFELADTANCEWEYTTDESTRFAKLIVYSESPFETISINGKSSTYADLIALSSVKAGTTLSFTVKEGYTVEIYPNYYDKETACDSYVFTKDVYICYYKDEAKTILTNVAVYEVRNIQINGTNTRIEAHESGTGLSETTIELEKNQTTLPIKIKDSGSWFYSFENNETRVYSSMDVDGDGASEGDTDSEITYYPIPAEGANINIESASEVYIYKYVNSEYIKIQRICFKEYSMIESISRTYYSYIDDEIKTDKDVVKVYGKEWQSNDGIILDLTINLKSGESAEQVFSASDQIEGIFDNPSALTRNYDEVYILLTDKDHTMIYDYAKVNCNDGLERTVFTSTSSDYMQEIGAYELFYFNDGNNLKTTLSTKSEIESFGFGQHTSNEDITFAKGDGTDTPTVSGEELDLSITLKDYPDFTIQKKISFAYCISERNSYTPNPENPDNESTIIKNIQTISIDVSSYNTWNINEYGVTTNDATYDGRDGADTLTALEIVSLAYDYIEEYPESASDAIKAEVAEGYSFVSGELFNNNGIVGVKITVNGSDGEKTYAIMLDIRGLYDSNTDAQYTINNSSNTVASLNGVLNSSFPEEKEIEITPYAELMVKTSNEDALVLINKTGGFSEATDLLKSDHFSLSQLELSTGDNFYIKIVASDHRTSTIYKFKVTVNNSSSSGSETPEPGEEDIIFAVMVGENLVYCGGENPLDFIWTTGESDMPERMDAWLNFTDAQLESVVTDGKVNVYFQINDEVGMTLWKDAECTESQLTTATGPDQYFELDVLTNDDGKKYIVVYLNMAISEDASMTVPVYVWLGCIATMNFGSQTYHTGLSYSYLNYLLNMSEFDAEDEGSEGDYLQVELGDFPVYLDATSGAFANIEVDEKEFKFTLTLEAEFPENDYSYYVFAGNTNAYLFQQLCSTSEGGITKEGATEAGMTIYTPEDKELSITITDSLWTTSGEYDVLYIYVVMQGNGGDLHYSLPIIVTLSDTSAGE